MIEFSLIKLDFDQLESFLSKETIDYHYGKHHAGYVKNLNSLMQVSNMSKYISNHLTDDEKLIEIITVSHNEIAKNNISHVQAIFNNAAQIWNHNFYWLGLTNLTSDENNLIPNSLKEKIIHQYRSLDQFKDEFKHICLSHFGSGWCWLVLNEANDLEIVSTSNADMPMFKKMRALWTCDLWEHSYYIDYRNSRADYIDKMWRFVNWKFIAQNYDRFMSMTK